MPKKKIPALTAVLRAEMARRGVPAVWLVKQSGLSAGHVSDLLNGRSVDVRLTTLQALAGAFKWKTQALISRIEGA